MNLSNTDLMFFWFAALTSGAANADPQLFLPSMDVLRNSSCVYVDTRTRILLQ